MKSNIETLQGRSIGRKIPSAKLVLLTAVNRALYRASDAMKLPHFKPHAMRAYYVKVRRSQGEDAAPAWTLLTANSEKSDTDLIRPKASQIRVDTHS